MKYTKPVGAAADLRELEYISALHQTGSNLRQDGSIQTEDICKFLLSRFGIKVSEEELSDTIARGFSGGGISEDDGDTLDLCEMVAMLLVPTLLKAEMSLHRDLLERRNIRNGHVGLHHREEQPLDNDFEESYSPNELHSDEFNENPSTSKKLHIDKAGEDHVWNSGLKDGVTNRPLRGDDRWPDSDLIKFVLSMILRDVTGDEMPKTMTKELLKEIFVFYGEHEISEDERLLEEMITMASAMAVEGTTNNNGPILDEVTFAHCLTDDVRAYDITTENRLSTNVEDVFTEMQHGESVPVEDLYSPSKVFTFPSIDYAVDTFRSKIFVVLLWVIWALGLLVWIGLDPFVGNLNCQEKEDQDEGHKFGCRIAQGIINWLVIMCQLVIIGSGSVLLCSAGQGETKNNPLLIIFSMGCICMITFVPAFKGFRVDDVDRDGYLIDTTIDGEELPQDKFLRSTIVACGIILILLSIQNLIDRITPSRIQTKYKWMKSLLVSGTVRMERNMKKAASFKVNRMVRDAISIHKAAAFEHGGVSSNSKDSSYGRALLAYTKAQDVKEDVGGLFWCWKRIWSGTLFTEDGIWLNNRMVQGNVVQIIICLWLIPFFASVIQLINEFYELYGLFRAFMDAIMPVESADSSMAPIGSTTWPPTQSPAFDTIRQLQTDDFLAEANPENYIPDRWRIVVPIAIAITLSMWNAITLAFKYLPSSVGTVLEFRYGTIGSLHNEDFLSLRRDVDSASLIFPAMFWGTIVSSVFVFFSSLVFFGLMFLEPFTPFFISIAAAIIGALITIGLKTLFLMVAHKYSHERAYYRTRPAVANVVGVFLESWNLGITVFYIFKRMVTLIVCAFIFIGRIDIPFLSEAADEIGPARLDNFPLVFRKDLLMHDAHRHPYLERLGLIYIMKLRYGNHFGREAGTSWRLLFVFALFPWLRQFRIRSSDDIKFDAVKFSKDGTAFQNFTALASKGKKFGRLVENPKAQNESDDSSSERTTIDCLKKEVSDLKEENSDLVEKLKQLENVVEGLNSQLEC